MNRLQIKSRMTLIFFFYALSLFFVTPGQADVGTAVSNIFQLDTRENLPPDGPWQILTNKSNTYNEDLIIDNHGKVWAFYLRSKGTGQPVYMKILRSNGFVYKSEEVIGTATSLQKDNRQTVRAGLNTVTGDVWVVIQGEQDGKSKGYFVIFDSTGTRKVEPVFLPGTGGTYYPKMACDASGVMWFIWQTDSSGTGFSVPAYACYNSGGSLTHGPANVSNTGNTSDTDIAIDLTNNRIWFIYERGNKALFTRIINNDETRTQFQGERLRVNQEVAYPFYPQRIVFADSLAHRMWLLARNADLDAQEIRILDFDGDEVGAVSRVGKVYFSVNEFDRLEVIRYSGSAYQKGEFDPRTGKTISDPKFSDLFTKTFESVNHGIAFNRSYESLKAYLVQTDSNITKFYLHKIVKAPNIYVTPQTIDFDTVRLNISKRDTILVENTGTALLSITSITSNDPQFTVDINKFNLEPGQRQKVIVTFRPTLLGISVGALTITSNDPDESPFILQVEGVGRTEKDQKIVVSADSLDFGLVPTTTFGTRTFTVSNQGEKILNVTNLEFLNDLFSSEFDSLIVSPGATREVVVKFQPTQPESAYGRLELQNDDPTSWIEYVYLVGAGRPPSPREIKVESDTLNFNNVVINSQVTKTINVQNIGEQDLEITNVQTSDSAFKPQTTSFTIPGGRQYELPVSFRPREVKAYSDTLRITCNDTAHPQVFVFLKGAGQKVNQPTIAVSSDSIYFGGVQKDTRKIRWLKVWNKGDLILDINNILVDGSQFSIKQKTFSLNPQESLWLEITYQPNSLETHNGALTIISNDPNNDSLHVGLSGNGIDENPPQIAVNPQELVFDTTAINQKVLAWLYISNQGQQALTVSDVTTTNKAQFKVSSEEFELKSGQGKYLSVTFQPTATGLIEAQLVIESNDPTDGTLRIRLAGVGRQQLPQQIYVYPEELAFGTVAIGDSASSPLLVKNTGERNLTIKKVTSDNNQFFYRKTDVTIPPKSSSYLPIMYKPEAAGSVSADLTIFSDATNDTAKNVTVSGNGRSLKLQKIYWNPERLTFETTPLGSSSQQSLWVYNQGEQVLEISNIQISDSVFKTASTKFSVGPGKFKQVVVTFTPTHNTSASGILEISNNDATNPKVRVSLQGPTRDLYPQQIEASRSELNFGSVAVGKMVSRNVYLYNRGEKDLRISNIFIDDQQFSVNSTAFTIRPNDSKLLIVTYLPANLDTAISDLTIVSNSNSQSNLNIKLYGHGRQRIPQQIVVIPADTLDFGLVPQYTSKILNVIIRNAGEEPLTISNYTLYEGPFMLRDSVAVLQPEQQHIIPIEFTTDKLRRFERKLIINSNDPNNSTLFIYLIGEGRELIPPTLALQPPDGLKYNSVGVGLWDTQILTFSNNGESELKIKNIEFTNPHFGAEIDRFEIAPDSSFELGVTFAPSDTDTFRCQLNFETNDPKQEQVSVPLEGVGREKRTQKLVFEPDTLVFDSIGIGRTAYQYFIIKNEGEFPLLIKDIVTDNHQFRVDTTNFPIPALMSQPVQVAFTPILVGNDSTRLTIFSNDPAKPDTFLFVRSSSRELVDQQIMVHTQKIAFDSVNVTKVAMDSFRVTNIGDFPLEVSNIMCADSQFTVNDTTFSLTPFQSRWIKVFFAPIQAGNFESKLIIYSDDPQNPASQITLNGTGRPLSDQRIAINREQIDFGMVALSDSALQRIWVINLGEKVLTVDSVGVNDDHFKIDKTYFHIDPAGSRESWVTFRPTNYDTVRAQMTFKSNDPLNPYLDLPLTGSGRDLKPPQLAVSPVDIDFGLVGWGQQVARVVRLTNSGEMPLNVTQILSSDTLQFRVHPTALTINAGSNQAANVLFMPTLTRMDSSQQQFEGTISVITNAQTEYVTVKGTGRPLSGPIISIPVASLDFDTVAVGRTSTKKLQINNEGELDLLVSNIEIETADKIRQFKIDKRTFRVRPKHSETVAITYLPTQVDSIQTNLVITSNDTTSPRYALPVTAYSVNYNGPMIVVRPGELHFGFLLKGAKQIKSLYVSNDGPKPLHIQSLVLSDELHFSAKMTNMQVASGDSQRLDVTFLPDAVNSYSATLSIRNNDKYNQTISVPLTGTGIKDSTGTPVFALLNWKPETTPFNSTKLGNQTTAWFVRDFEFYDEPTSAVLRLAYQQGIQVFLNGSLIYNGANDNASFTHWNKELEFPNLVGYLVYGRNRLAVKVLASNGQVAFNADFQINGNYYILRGDENPGNPLALWWYYVGNPPVTMPGTGRYWYTSEYGWDGLDPAIGLWSFGEGSGNILYDNSRFGRRAFLFGTQWKSGLGRQVLEFNGSNSYVKLEANINTIPLTVQMWLNCFKATSPKNQLILSNADTGGKGHGIYLTPDSKIAVSYFNGEFKTDYALESNSWHFLSVRYFADSIHVYVDGRLVGSKQYSLSEPTGYTYCHLGGESNLPPDLNAFKGAISDVQIYNTHQISKAVPAVIQAQPIFSTVATAATAATLQFRLNPPIANTQNGKLKYRLGGAAAVREVAVSVNSDSLVTATIPASAVTVRGLNYRLDVVSDLGTIRYPNNSDTTAMAWMVIRTRGETAPIKTLGEIYQMVSVPYNLGSKSVKAVFEDDFGPYDPYNWRLYQWISVASNLGMYVENEAPGWNQNEQNFSRGNAFWLITYDGNKTFDADSGYSAENCEPFELTLKPGWNQIGCPFPFAVNWDSVAKSVNISGLYFFNPATNGYEINHSIMSPWQGYFVNNQLSYPYTVNIPAREHGVFTAKTSLANDFLICNEKASFVLAISGQCGHFHDRDNLLAVTENASNNWDPADALEAPPIGNYISIAIDNREWEQRANRYCVDVRASGEPGYVWKLTCEGQITRFDKQVELNFDNQVPLAAELKLFLFDLKDEVAINLHTETHYHFEVVRGKSFKRDFKVVLGDEAFVRQHSDGIPLVPLTFELLQNYPNPFNPTTVIRFSIPQKSRTRLLVYNILGQQVALLVDDELNAARHQVIWNGTNSVGIPVASGLYFIQLRALDQVQIRKIMLIR